MLCIAAPSNCLSCILFELKTHKGNIFLFSARSAILFLNWPRPFDVVSCSSVMPTKCLLSTGQWVLQRMSSLSGFCGLQVQLWALLQPEIRPGSLLIGRKRKCWKFLMLINTCRSIPAGSVKNVLCSTAGGGYSLFLSKLSKLYCCFWFWHFACFLTHFSKSVCELLVTLQGWFS